MIAVRSAPGKLMLFGEYAVLEGYPAVALCFDRRIRCQAEGGGGELRFAAPGLLDAPVTVSLASLADAGATPPRHLELLWPLLQEAAPALGGLSLRFDAGFPATWGLGSSSASLLSAVAAVRALLGEEPDAAALFGEVRTLQRRVQGEASGYDGATQLLGGAVLYQLPDTLRSLDVPDLGWRVAYTGSKASTGAWVRRVRERFPRGSEVFARIGALAQDGAEALVARDAVTLGALMNRGQEQLRELGAVPPELGARVAAMQAAPGILGARMCGAGGGDCALLLAPDRARAAAAVQAAGLQLLPLSFTSLGLQVEAPEPDHDR